MVKILVFDTETTDKPPYLPGAQWAERQSFDKSLLTQSGLETSWVSMKDKWLRSTFILTHSVCLAYLSREELKLPT